MLTCFQGGDLFDAITQSVKFGEVDAAHMVKDLCSALFYLHSRVIVHRDLKPENLLVSLDTVEVRKFEILGTRGFI